MGNRWKEQEGQSENQDVYKVKLNDKPLYREETTLLGWSQVSPHVAVIKKN